MNSKTDVKSLSVQLYHRHPSPARHWKAESNYGGNPVAVAGHSGSIRSLGRFRLNHKDGENARESNHLAKRLKKCPKIETSQPADAPQSQSSQLRHQSSCLKFGLMVH